MALRRLTSLSRFFTIFALIAALSYLGHSWYLLYSGYCFDAGRYLTDEELIGAAFAANRSFVNSDFTGLSIENFRQSHPKCCAVLRTGGGASTGIGKVFGSHSVEVEINFEVPPEKVQQTKEGPYKFYRSYVQVSACGTAVNRYGEYTKILETAGNH